MTIRKITEYAGVEPNRSQPPAEFNANINDKFLWQTASAIEYNLMADDVDAVAQEVDSNAVQVYTALSSTSATVITQTAEMWESGDFVKGDLVWSPSNSLNYRCKTGTVGTPFSSSTDPINDPTNWVLMLERLLIYEQRTSNTMLEIGDRQKVLDCTGTWTQTFATCAILGAGWNTIIKNSGAGIITLDPYGSETIDGAATLTVYPGEVVMMTCTGTSLVTACLTRSLKTLNGKTVFGPASPSMELGLRSMQVFTSSGTWTRPDGITLVKVIVVGGGANGEYVNNGGGYGGGGGGTAIKTIDVTSLSTQSVVVGAVSGNSSFGSVVGNGATDRTGGTASGGDINLSGGDGGTNNAVGGTSIVINGMGGESIFTGAGKSSLCYATYGNGSPATGYGCGGAGSLGYGGTSGTVGAGKQGIIIVEEYG